MLCCGDVDWADLLELKAATLPVTVSSMLLVVRNGKSVAHVNPRTFWLDGLLQIVKVGASIKCCFCPIFFSTSRQQRFDQQYLLQQLKNIFSRST